MVDGANLYVAGTTESGGLNSGTVTRAYSGGQDGFVAKISSDLVADAGDRVSYIGGSGDDTIAGLAIQNGEVYIGGDTTAAFGGQSGLRDQDGYVARLDSAGALDWTQRVAGGANYAAGAFSVSAQGASALDRLGLPQARLHSRTRPISIP